PTTVPSVPRIGAVAAPNGAAPTATPASGQTASAAATDPAQQAIQQVIQRGDEEQALALASNDPTVMADTSTPDFYQTQVATNQDLTANGVSAIKLVNIEWGPVSVSGTTATATAWETWTTSYSDGTTEQSRDAMSTTWCRTMEPGRSPRTTTRTRSRVRHQGLASVRP